MPSKNHPSLPLYSTKQPSPHSTRLPGRSDKPHFSLTSSRVLGAFGGRPLLWSFPTEEFVFCIKQRQNSRWKVWLGFEGGCPKRDMLKKWTFLPPKRKEARLQYIIFWNLWQSFLNICHKELLNANLPAILTSKNHFQYQFSSTAPSLRWGPSRTTLGLWWWKDDSRTYG